MPQQKRQSIRLRGWDYTQAGAYFITICTHQRECLFDNADFRDVVENAWRNIPTHPHAARVHLDEWVVMPNHLHGILMLVDDGDEADSRSEAGGRGRGEANRIDGGFANDDAFRFASPLRETSGPDEQTDNTLQPGSIGAIVGNFKSLVARRINNLRRTPGGKVWQRGYYDRIIRNDRELDAIREYIQTNPQRWAEDRDNLDELLAKMDYHPL